jgi:UDP:flavonoid glycosyltransferase YjiC (YdhE family)
MSNILFTWEMGAGTGHLVRHLPIARLMRQRGHEVLFAIRERDIFIALAGEEGFASVQAPCCIDSEAASRELLNYADILAANGFGDASHLSLLMDKWVFIFQEFRPDVVVAQFAPSSILAAYLLRIPALLVDCGFGCPPDEAPFPCFRPWLNISRETLMIREQRVLGHINQVCAERSVPTFSSLQKVFRTSAGMLLTVPELDHYTGRRDGRYIGPIVMLDDGVETEWPEGSAPRIFVYLRPFDELLTILQILSASGCNVIANLPGIGDDIRSAFTSQFFRISTTAVRLSRLLPTADIVINYGGHGLASACLLAGAPMLVVPQLAEQLMTAHNFERLGIGEGVRCDEVAVKFAPALRRMLKDSSYRENAGRLSHKYAGYDQAEVIRRLCDTIEEKAAGVDVRF